MPKHLMAGVLSCAAGLLLCGPVSGQAYPSKTVRIITTNIAGANDFMARAIAPALAESLGQPVVVNNFQPFTAIELAAKAPPDGYSVLIQTGALWIGELLQKVNYNTTRDFAPITLMARVPLVLVVHPSLPVKSVKDLIALAKAKPGAMNYASGSLGGTSHLSGELLKALGGVNIVQVTYGGKSVAGVVSGEVHMTFDPPSGVMELVKAGKLKALGVTSLKPSPLVPGLPSLAETGLPGYESTSTTGVLAPAKTAGEIINRLNQEVVRVLNQPEMKKKLFDSGYEAVGSSPEVLATQIKSDTVKWGKLIKDLGIGVQ